MDVLVFYYTNHEDRCLVGHSCCVCAEGDVTSMNDI